MENLRYFENRTHALQTLDSETPQVWYVEDEDLTLFTEYTEDNLEVIPLVDTENNIYLKVKVLYKGLKFTSIGNSTIYMSNTGGNTPDMKYSLDDGETWTQWDYSEISLTDNQNVCFKGNNPNGFSTGTTYSRFRLSGQLNVSGNIMSLLDDGTCDTLVIPSTYCFYMLFYNCSALTTAPELPATTLTNYCYYDMFHGCTGLVNGPTLPAHILTSACYMNMFYGCTSLTNLTCLGTTKQATSISNWLSRISTNGTLYVDPSMINATWNIPNTWTIQAIS